MRTMRVLIAEDAPRLAQLLRRGLQDDGHAVDVTGTGTDALWLGQENPYDAILLDVMLPGLTGFEVCQRLRAARCSVPVIMLTARDSVEDRVRGLDLGADDYLTKPFSFAELTARLRAVTRREHPPRPSVLTFDDLTVDPVSFRVWRGDVEISLSVKEFALLEYLMRSPGTVRTRTEILDHVWDFAYDGVSNVVDQYVRYLRRKIDRPFHRHDLQTVRGRGYRLGELRGEPGGGLPAGGRPDAERTAPADRDGTTGHTGAPAGDHDR